MSSIAATVYETLCEEIMDEITVFAAGYTETTMKNYTDRGTDTLKSVKFMQGMKETDKLDELGNKLYDDVSQATKGFGEAFARTLIIDLNYDLCIKELIMKRTTVQEDIDGCEVDEIILVPLKEKFQFKATQALKIELEAITKAHAGTEAELREKIEDAKTISSDKAKANYYKSYDTYEQAVEQQNKNKIIIKEKKREMQKLTNKEVMIKSFQDANFAIINKIRDSLVKFPELQKVLKGSTTIPASGVKIIDPLGSYKLSGVITLLHENDRKQGIVSLISTLVDAFDQNVSDKEVYADPALPLLYTDKLLSDWLRKDLFEKLTIGQVISGVILWAYLC